MAEVTRAGRYTMQAFITDVQGIMRESLDRAAAVKRVTRLLQSLLLEDGVLEQGTRVDLGDGRYKYEFFKAPDGSLTVTAPVFLPGRPTPVHDHMDWGVVGVYAGRQRTTRYRRVDDGSRPGRAHLEVESDEVLTRGDTYALLPPDDIHRIEALGDEPGISIHVLGMDVTRQRRHVYDPDKGTVREVEGESMMR